MIYFDLAMGLGPLIAQTSIAVSFDVSCDSSAFWRMANLVNVTFP
jgi:hypothetical protein